jgi:hypothetical protein
MHIGIHTLSGIRNHDPSVWAEEETSWFNPRGHCDRQEELLQNLINEHVVSPPCKKNVGSENIRN